MSRTMIKNGQRVYDAIAMLTGRGVGNGWEKVTTARVAEKANVSKPTAKKYLTIMWEYGIITRTLFEGKVVLWSWLRED